jgi:hypothetical protein
MKATQSHSTLTRSDIPLPGPRPGWAVSLLLRAGRRPREQRLPRLERLSMSFKKKKTFPTAAMVGSLSGPARQSHSFSPGRDEHPASRVRQWDGLHRDGTGRISYSWGVMQVRLTSLHDSLIHTMWSPELVMLAFQCRVTWPQTSWPRPQHWPLSGQPPWP